jgi:hypothetical protein
MAMVCRAERGSVADQVLVGAVRRALLRSTLCSLPLRPITHEV